MLALPVLAGSAAFAVGEALGWPVGLARRPKRAKAFYGTIAAATVIGGLIIATILNIMNLVGIQSQPQLVIKGLVILVAVFFSSGDGPRRLVRSRAAVACPY